MNVLPGKLCRHLAACPPFAQQAHYATGPLADNFGDFCFASLSSLASAGGEGGGEESQSCMTSAKWWIAYELHKLSWIRLIKITARVINQTSKWRRGEPGSISFELWKNCKYIRRLWSIEFWLDASERKTDTRSKGKTGHNLFTIPYTHTLRDTEDFSICVLHGKNWKTRSANWVFSIFRRERVENVYVNFEMQRIEKVFHARHVAHSATPLSRPPLSLSSFSSTWCSFSCLRGWVCVCEKLKKIAAGKTGENSETEVAFQVLHTQHNNCRKRKCKVLLLPSSTPTLSCLHSSLSAAAAAVVAVAVWTATASEIAAKWLSDIVYSGPHTL